MTAQELIQELPKAVLMWYPFEEGKKKFIIDGRNMEHVGELESNADYVIVTQEIEKAACPEKVLSILKGKINPGGKLFLLMNNRLGLRYFCGDRDPYTGSVLDCLEDYHNLNRSDMSGRMYDQQQMKRILQKAGFEHFRFFSVFTDLDNPSLIFSEDYIPNENLTNRMIPSYHFPETVFLEEKAMYQQLIDNHMFHQMANAYLAECSPDGSLSNISHVTSSLERGREDALFTVIYQSGMVEKKAAYPEGRNRLKELNRNMQELKSQGIDVVEGILERDSYKMQYVHEETAQMYLSHLLRADADGFVREMDHFRDLILRSSEIEVPDKGDGEGAVLKHGFLDMVPLNSFHIGDRFVFFDQEFRRDHYPANVLIWRMVASFYAADMEADRIYPRDRMLLRYDLKRRQEKWQTTEWDFLKALRKENILEEYHTRIRADKNRILDNR